MGTGLSVVVNSSDNKSLAFRKFLLAVRPRIETLPLVSCECDMFVTNKKQALAVWVFGLLIALGLVVSESYILALVVSGGLVVFGLRSKETARGREATASPNQSTDSEAARLQICVTSPHTLLQQ